jgi:hypothetical protein
MSLTSGTAPDGIGTTEEAAGTMAIVATVAIATMAAAIGIMAAMATTVDYGIRGVLS